MKRFFLPALLALIFVLGVVTIIPNHGYALTEIQKIEKELASLRSAQEDAKRTQEQAQSQILVIQKEREVLEAEVAQINYQMDQNGQRLTELLGQIDEVTLELEQTGEELQAATERVEARDIQLKSRIRLMYTNGTVSYLEVLLSATSFSDFLDRMNALQSFVGQDKKILELNKQDRMLIAEKKLRVEEQLAEVGNLYAEAEQVMRELQLKEQEKEVRIASLDRTEEQLVEVTEAQEQMLASSAAEISRKMAEKDQLQRQAVYSGGQLGFPLPQAYPITSGFGSRIDPITKQKGAFHAGIDYGAPGGTNVLAAEAGTVIVAGWWGGYGNTVIIEHNGLRTLYAHMRSNSIVVEVGQEVARGEKLGTVGTTGRSTGNHLHFGVYKNDEAVDPGPYLK